MTGWIIYSMKDVEKNKSYIQMYVDRFQPYGVKLCVIILEEIKDMEAYIRKNRPDFAINRSRNAIVAVSLENAGVRVFNRSVVTEIANNKGKSYALLEGTVPFMPLRYQGRIITSGIESSDFSYPLVIKSCVGHGGNQVFMAEDEREESAAIQKIRLAEKAVPEAVCESASEESEYVIQQCCSDLGRDVRVYVIGNKITAAVLRTSENSFKSNYSLGGKAETYQLNSEEKEMVHAILKKLPLDYGGIDFIFHQGKAVFNEIEDAVGARMLYQTSDIDIVQKYVEYIMNTL